MAQLTIQSLFPVVGIDPGKGGAIAVMQPNGEISSVKMPDTTDKLVKHLRDLKELGYCKVWLEKLHTMPMRGSIANFKLGMNYGMLKGILTALDMDFEEVTAKDWAKGLEFESIPKEKYADRKRRLKEVAILMYPEKKITLINADAMLIATYGWEKARGAIK